MVMLVRPKPVTACPRWTAVGRQLRRRQMHLLLDATEQLLDGMFVPRWRPRLP